MSALTMLGLAVMGAVLYTLFQKKRPGFRAVRPGWEPLSSCCGKSARQRRPCFPG